METRSIADVATLQKTFDFYAPLDEQVDRIKRSAAADIAPHRESVAAHVRGVAEVIANDCAAGNFELAQAVTANLTEFLAAQVIHAEWLRQTAGKES